MEKQRMEIKYNFVDCDIKELPANVLEYIGDYFPYEDCFPDGSVLDVMSLMNALKRCHIFLIYQFGLYPIGLIYVSKPGNIPDGCCIHYAKFTSNRVNMLRMKPLIKEILAILLDKEGKYAYNTIYGISSKRSAYMFAKWFGFEIVEYRKQEIYNVYTELLIDEYVYKLEDLKNGNVQPTEVQSTCDT